MKNIKEVYELLKEPKKIGIICHPMPDGDAFGSMLGLGHFLQKLNHDVRMISPTSWGDFLAWMPGVDQILDYSNNNNRAIETFKDIDLLFCLDFNAPNRLGALEDFVFNSSSIKILIDHHLEPDENSFDYGISNSEKSSTSEMIFDFIKMGDKDDLIDQNIMTCIYTGVLTDTGSFRFPATSASVHKLIAEFKEKGLVHHTIHENLFNNDSLERLRFTGYILSKKLVVIPEKQTAYIYVSKSDIEKFDVNLHDLEGLVSLPLSIKNINISALFSERDKEIKISLRSVGDIDVSQMCRTYFNGGGHKNASGGKSNSSITETIKKFMEIL